VAIGTGRASNASPEEGRDQLKYPLHPDDSTLMVDVRS
jgi:hypothetical protein